MHNEDLACVNVGNVSLLFGALYATCPYSAVRHMPSVRILVCFICKVHSWRSALYKKGVGQHVTRAGTDEGVQAWLRGVDTPQHRIQQLRPGRRRTASHARTNTKDTIAANRIIPF